MAQAQSVNQSINQMRKQGFITYSMDWKDDVSKILLSFYCISDGFGITAISC